MLGVRPGTTSIRPDASVWIGATPDVRPGSLQSARHGAGDGAGGRRGRGRGARGRPDPGVGHHAGSSQASGSTQPGQGPGPHTLIRADQVAVSSPRPSVRHRSGIGATRGCRGALGTGRDRGTRRRARGFRAARDSGPERARCRTAAVETATDVEEASGAAVRQTCPAGRRRSRTDRRASRTGTTVGRTGTTAARTGTGTTVSRTGTERREPNGPKNEPNGNNGGSNGNNGGSNEPNGQAKGHEKG